MTRNCVLNFIGRFGLTIAFFSILAISIGVPIHAQEKKVAPATQAEIDQAIDKGVRWLIETQEVDGGWKGPYPTSYQSGMTGLALYALLKSGLPADHRVIRKGLAFVNAKTCFLTYEVGTNLLAYSAIPAEVRPKKRIKKLTELLITTLEDKGWRYNRSSNNVIDLSNGQYAILGLRAAAAMGEKVPAKIWEKAAHIFMDLQGYYGGWGYKENCGWADAGMTAAGIFCLAACHEQLKHRKKSRLVVRKLKSKIDLGISWYEKNWSVTKNLILPSKQGMRAQYLYHYLYGLERVGALTGKDLFGGHDWYSEGATYLVNKQDGRGSWGTIYGGLDVNSALALLFLARGTNSTFAGVRKKSTVDGKSTESLSIRTNGKNPMIAWIMKIGKKVKTRLDNGEKISALVWKVNGEEVHRCAVSGPFVIRDDSTFLKHQFVANGKHMVVAKIEFIDDEGVETGAETSAPAVMWIDDIEGREDREAIADAGKNRLSKIMVIASSSSQHSDKTGAGSAVDGFHSTSWICAENDKSPRIELRLSKRVRARTLKIVGTHDYGKKVDNWARPKDIEIVINGRKRISLTLPDDVRRKHSVSIGKLNVHRIRITIKSLYPGKSNATRVGFKEIELYK